MKRESNYDLLRIISAAAVIMIHVSGAWFLDAVVKVAEYGVDAREIQAAFMICVYNSISRFAVPCFIMMSGAFILDNQKNAEYRYFYSKTFVKIGIPTIIFSILYILYRVSVYFVGRDKEISILLELLEDILRGTPMYHMWYLYMMIGVYALAPVVIRFKESITEEMFYKVSFSFLLFANLSRWITGEVWAKWSIGQSFEYLGYFMTGYCIRKILIVKKDNSKAFILILTGIFLEICAAGLKYKQLANGLGDNDLQLQIESLYFPFVDSVSVLFFGGFTLLNIEKEYANVSDGTFYVYLIHAGVWDFFSNRIAIGQNFIKGLNAGIWIPILTIAVFAMSYVLSKLYLWVWMKLDKEKRITSHLLKIARLEE